MSVKALAAQFSFPVLSGNDVLQDGVNVKTLVMEDLIQNAHTLFDEQPSPSEPVHLPTAAETTSSFTHDSLSPSPELPQQAEVEAMASTSRHGPGHFAGVLTSTQEQDIPEGRCPKAVETLAISTPAEVISARPTSVDRWRLQVPRSRLAPHLEALKIPRSPTEGVPSSTSDFISSATSLQTKMRPYSDSP